jgi:thiamine-phosphate pyrophosphorylase
VKHLGEPPYVFLITEGSARPENYELERSKILRTVTASAADGVSMVQVREKGLPARLLLDLTRAIVAAIADSPTLVMVNERADIAIASGADGVHLPAASLPAGVVRHIFGRKPVIGVSTHTLDGALAAAGSGADYIVFGPVFESPGKGPAAGIDSLAGICRAMKSVPTIALGGVDDKNFKQVLKAGAAGVAAIRALNDPSARREICRTIDVAYRHRSLE